MVDYTGNGDDIVPGNHRCPDCKTIYACCADECDEHYWLQCTPCEHIEYNLTLTNDKIKSLRIQVQRKTTELWSLETQLQVEIDRQLYREKKKVEESWKTI